MNAPRTTLLALILGAAATFAFAGQGEGTQWTDLGRGDYFAPTAATAAAPLAGAEESIYRQLAARQREDGGRHGMAGVSGESKVTGIPARGEESIYDQLAREYR